MGKKGKSGQGIGPAEARSTQVLTPSNLWGIPDPITLSSWVGDKHMFAPTSLPWHRPGQSPSSIFRTTVTFWDGKVTDLTLKLLLEVQK